MLWVVAVLWVVVAVGWLLSVPADAAGRRWHVVLAPSPLVAVAAAAAGGPVGDAADTWLAAGGWMLVALAATWLVGTALSNHGVMDIAYPVVGLVGATVAMWSGTGADWPIIVVGVWASRLSIATAIDNLGAERQPYAAWRARWGRRWRWWSFVQVHLLQGVTVWWWTLPFVFLFSAEGGWVPVGVAVAAGGILLEWVADETLRRFRRSSVGGLLTTGVWSWVRHPNYLGESLVWIGWAIAGLGAPFGWLGLVGAAFAAWFMGWGSAAPFKERHMARTRPEAWSAYAAVTPRFVPWPRSGRSV